MAGQEAPTQGSFPGGYFPPQPQITPRVNNPSPRANTPHQAQPQAPSEQLWKAEFVSKSFSVNSELIPKNNTPGIHPSTDYLHGSAFQDPATFQLPTLKDFLAFPSLSNPLIMAGSFLPLSLECSPNPDSPKTPLLSAVPVTALNSPSPQPSAPCSTQCPLLPHSSSRSDQRCPGENRKA